MSFLMLVSLAGSLIAFLLAWLGLSLLIAMLLGLFLPNVETK